MKYLLGKIIYLLEDLTDVLNTRLNDGKKYPVVGFSFDSPEDAEEFESDVYQAGLPEKSRYKIIGKYDYY